VTTVALLDRSRIVAGPGWSRWLVPPAALSIHLAIGSAYAWSVFKIPLEKSLHVSGTASAMPFTIAIVMLGLSAAGFGTRVDHYGPRWAMFIATVCFCSGLLIAGFGVSVRTRARPSMPASFPDEQASGHNRPFQYASPRLWCRQAKRRRADVAGDRYRVEIHPGTAAAPAGDGMAIHLASVLGGHLRLSQSLSGPRKLEPNEDRMACR
jgi:hypothetical protein